MVMLGEQWNLILFMNSITTMYWKNIFSWFPLLLILWAASSLYILLSLLLRKKNLFLAIEKKLFESQGNQTILRAKYHLWTTSCNLYNSVMSACLLLIITVEKIQGFLDLFGQVSWPHSWMHYSITQGRRNINFQSKPAALFLFLHPFWRPPCLQN